MCRFEKCSENIYPLCQYVCDFGIRNRTGEFQDFKLLYLTVSHVV